ncbi:MAG TPA: hypothetical protein EYG06_02520, partial [Myxococcales bacterium]|nr:hypothetical protein [Myxococcales bacterium]
MEAYIVSNGIVAVLLMGLVAVVVAVRRSRMWSDAFAEIWLRRRGAVCVIAVYLVVALLDSIAWVGGMEGGQDAVARHQAQSVIDRLFVGSQERSYSAPFAVTEFYGSAPLEHPGEHVLGTDLIGRDVLYLSLKGAR